MEPIQTRKTILLLIAGIALAGIIALAVTQTPKDDKPLAKSDQKASPPPVMALKDVVKSDLPILDLAVQFIDGQSEEIAGEKTRLGHKAEPTADKAAPNPSCSELVGGDASGVTDLAEVKKRAVDCKAAARWMVRRHPIALSLTVNNGQQLSDFLTKDKKLGELTNNRFFQGVFHDPLRDAGITAEDLQLDGLQGAFLRPVLAETLSAGAVLHYDIIHGKRGFVFSFVEERCTYFTKVLPVMAKVLGRSGYRVSTLQELVVEMRIGRQRLFLTRSDGRIFLANGLESLLNVLENAPATVKAFEDLPLVVTLRSQAYVANILPVLVGTEDWDLQLGLDLSETSPGRLGFPAGKLTQNLTAKIYRGVGASIPRDVFAALISSYALSPEMTSAEWQELASKGPSQPAASQPEEGGFALIWDLDGATDEITQVGVVIANPKNPGASGKFKQYFRRSERTAECGGGAVFLAATSDKLLTRMKESCRGQSASMLEWQGREAGAPLDTAQLYFFLNPGSGARELFFAGGAAAKGQDNGDFAPQWKKEYEQAKAAMRQDGEKFFSALPILAYSGSVAQAAKTVVLQGGMVKQGGAQ